MLLFYFIFIFLKETRALYFYGFASRSGHGVPPQAGRAKASPRVRTLGGREK